jgi:hypothetical protein
LAFHYLSTADRVSNVYASDYANPYAYAQLPGGGLRLPATIEFDMTPSIDDRLNFEVGLMTHASAFVQVSQPGELRTGFVPAEGLTVRMGRSSHAYQNSTFFVEHWTGGVAEDVAGASSGFQFEPAQPYHVVLRIAADHTVEALVTDASGLVIVSVSGSAGTSVGTLDQLYVLDYDSAVSFDSPVVGDFITLFDNIQVSGSSGFTLGFPLRNVDGTVGSPYTWPVTAIFDHSMPLGAFCPDTDDRDALSSVRAFNGEAGSGTDKQGDNDPGKPQKRYRIANSRDCPKRTRLQGYSQPSGAAFFTDGAINYQSGKGNAFLSYDGHPGYDYRAPLLTPVFSAAEGDIVLAPRDCDEGNPSSGKIEIVHASRYSTVYEHLTAVAVGVGHVVAGQMIGYSGDCHIKGSPHLHFGVKLLDGNGVPVEVDPYGWCQPGCKGSDPSLADPYEDNVRRPGIKNRLLWTPRK